MPADGLWTVYFGIGQTGDNMGSSWMQLDDVRLEGKVPEAPTMVLLAAGLLALGVGRARRANR